MKKYLMQNPRVIKTFCTNNIYTIGPFMTTNKCVIAIYPDLRGIFCRPRNLKAITQEIIKFIKKQKIEFDFIVGGATAGIPVATVVGLLMNKPVGYVRKKSKGGGTDKLVEGVFAKGQKALLIDDAHGHGAGKPIFLKHIREAGFKVDWLIVVASRGHKNPAYFKWFKKARVNFASFCDITGIVDYAVKQKKITPEAGQLLLWFSQDAFNWHKDKKKWQYFLDYKKKKKYESIFGV